MTKRFEIKLSPERRADLAKLANQTGVSAADLAKLAITRMLEDRSIVLPQRNEATA